MSQKILLGTDPEVNPGLCLKLRHKKSTCRLCLENCPTGAISFGESLQIDYSLCHGCGICASLCPTDVFELRDLPYELLLTQMKGRDTVEFNCPLSSSNKDSLSVPCLGYLNEAVLVGATAGGVQAIRLNVSQCKKCDFALGLRVAMKSIKRASRILALFGLARNTSVSTGGSGSVFSLRQNKLYSRREFFSYLQWKTLSQMATAMDSTISDRGEVPAKTKVILEPRLPEKRSLLLEYIKKLGQPVTDQARADGLPFTCVEINDRCNGCGMCVTFCPTGALRSYDQGNRQVIDFSLEHCLTCNLCSDICPEGAITNSTYFNPHDLTTTVRQTLIEHRKSACLECGQSYIVVSGSSLCLDCSKKQKLKEWVARTL